VTEWPADVNEWPADVTEWLADIAVNRLETGDCRHLRESPSYRPPPSLRHLITIRQPTCSFPGCRRPAMRCDEDHTPSLPYDQGGRTCECNLAQHASHNYIGGDAAGGGRLRAPFRYRVAIACRRTPWEPDCEISGVG